MNYKNWDNRRGNRGRGRGNGWNWRGRGHHRMPMVNTFLPNIGWTNSSTNYNHYRLPHHEPNGYYYTRYPKPSSLPINCIMTKTSSPLPGSEEYTQNKIQQTSDLIKRQLNIDSETCANDVDFPSNLDYSECSNNNSETLLQENLNVDSPSRLTDSKRTMKQIAKRNKSPELIDVQEIHDKIIKHISNLSYSKKMNLVNQSTSGYDIAIQEVQRQKRLELSRALRDMSKRQAQSSDDGEVINSIIPDIGIKIEDLPNDIIAELSNSLNLHLDDHIPCLVDPEACFKQAEEILNVNCFEGDDEPSLKFFEHNLMINQRMNSQIRDGSETFENIAKNAIPIIDNNLLDKQQPEYPLICNTSFQNNRLHGPPTSSQIQASKSFIEGASFQDDNEKSDDDYARDLEFNNFCFENFDFNKSYLVPAKPEIQDFNDTSTVNITPKISVRKDILLETNISDETQHMSKSKTISFSNTDLPLNAESPFENTKFLSNSDTSHLLIQCDNNLPETRTINKFTSVDQNAVNELLDLNRIEKESNADKNTTNMTPNSTSNLQNAELGSHIKESSPLLNQHDTISDISSQSGNQASPNVNQFSQNLEYCAQKRWRSPGEKKMMADIQGKASVIVNAVNMNIESKQYYPNLDDNVQNEPLSKLRSPIVNEINTDTEKTDEPGNNNLIAVKAKSAQEMLVEDEYLNICNKSKETPLKVQNESHVSLNKVHIDQDIHIGSERDSLENLQESAHQKSPEHETKLTNELSKPQTRVSEQNQNVKQKKAKPANSKNTLKTSNNKIPIKDDKKDLLSVIVQPTECNNKNTLNDRNDADIKTKFDADTAPKEHRKIKTAAEKKETVPLSKSVSTIATQTVLNNTENVTSKITKNIDVQTMPEIKSKTDNPKNAEKSDFAPVIKSVQSIHTQTIAETKLEKLKVTEKKETQNPKTCRTVYVQTHLENNASTENAKIKLKECKNAEVQANSLSISTGVQTNVNLENYEKEVRTPNCINYILKLKRIDEEIENLLQAKKNLYKAIEDGYRSSQSNDILNLQEKEKKENCIKEDAANIPRRKHKKTDSDNEFDGSMHNPKRKKRHRSSKKSHSQINLCNKLSDPVNQAIDSNKIEHLRLSSAEIDEDKRKPLSIKISLKNLKQSSPKQEFGEVPKKRTAEVNTKKSTCGNSVEGNGQNAVFDDVKSDLCTTKLPKRKDSTDRKLDNENINVSKTPTLHESPNGNNGVSDIQDALEEKHFKTLKSKKLKTVKNDLYNLKLSDHEQIFNKRCHVVIERCTIEYLEGLKRQLNENNVSPKNVFSQVPPHQKANEDISSTNCDKIDLEFKDFLGAALDIKVVQEVLLVAADSGHLYFFDVNTGDVINSLSISEKPLTSIYTSISDQQCNVYVGCLTGVLTTLDFASKNVSNSIQCEEGIQCLEKGWEYMFMGSQGGLVMRYNFKKHKLEPSLKIYDSNILSIKATKEGARRVIIVASRSTEITVRDAMSGLLLRVMDSNFYPTVYAMLLIDNFVYCGTSQHDVLVFTFQDGRLQFKYEAVNSKGIVCLKIVGDLLFAGCYNGNIYIYSVSSKKFLGQIAGPGGMLLSMEVHGSKIFVGTKGNKLQSLTIPEVLLSETS